MAVSKTKSKTFNVTGTIQNLQISVPVCAPSLEDALLSARKLKFNNFVNCVEGDILDYSGPEITSIWENN